MKVDTYKHLDDTDRVTLSLSMPELAAKIVAMNYGAHRMLSALIKALRDKNDRYLATASRPELHEKQSPLAAKLEELLNTRAPNGTEYYY